MINEITQRLTKKQISIARHVGTHKIFLEGHAGTGKTTAGVNYLINLVKQGFRGGSILILVPQRTLSRPYLKIINDPDFPPGGIPTIQTMGGLAQRAIALFWPSIAGRAGFKNPQKQPKFLTIETAQYFMAQVVKPLIDRGYFENVTLDQNRLYSQILDNMNKSAGVGFPLSEIGTRLKNAWLGDEGQASLFTQVQETALLFRKFCLENNYLDFSLTFEVFTKSLWNTFIFREYLKKTYRHLIYENVEEDIPIVHDLIGEWLPDFQSSLLIYDQEAGYRTFLGADPVSGYRLKDSCEHHLVFNERFIGNSALDNLKEIITQGISRRKIVEFKPTLSKAYSFVSHKYVPDMVYWLSQKINELITDQKVGPNEIAVLSPFMSDSLQFTILSSLKNYNISCFTHKPSRSTRDEPIIQALFTIAKLAHPHWDMKLDRFNLRTAYFLVFQDCDLVRADLLAQISLSQLKSGKLSGCFDRILPEMQERFSYEIGNRFEGLMKWITDYLSSPIEELDIFFCKLFGEILSQPGYRFFQNLDAAFLLSQINESIQSFRKILIDSTRLEVQSLAKEYITMVESGILSAQYPGIWDPQTSNSVIVSPAYSYLMSNHPVRYQFWLDASSLGWWERLFQPLTHPYVLSRHWDAGKVWTDADEYDHNQKALIRLVNGLINRCKDHIFICSLGMNESGQEERGPLLHAFQAIAKAKFNMDVTTDV